jgi:riboflavin synthase
VFTGLVETIGRVVAVQPAGPGRRLRIAGAFRDSLPPAPLVLGESVAVDGACLTVTALGAGGTFDVDASHETCERTTLGGARAGRRVHLERALRLGDRLGGHWVTGHVDAVGRLLERRPAGDAWDLAFSTPDSLAPFVVEKGSIAVDGVSLTVNGCAPGRFSVTVVPFTGGATLLLERAPGETVNLETDLLGKYVVHVLAGRGPGAEAAGSDATLAAALRRAGFL